MNVQFPLPAAVNSPLNQSTQAALSSTQEGSFSDLLAQASAGDKKMADTAKQFEAVMAGEILKAARASSQGGWLASSDGEDDQTGEMTVELAEQGLAQGLAETGALGIAKMVLSQLHRSQPTETSSETPR